MLAKTLLTPRARLFWLFFIAFAPLAYLAGSLLVARYDPIAQADFQYDRPQLVSIASGIATEHGLDVRDWTSFLKTGWDNSLLLYYRVRADSDRESLRRVAPPTWVQVQLRSPDGKEGFEVTLTPEGALTGFRHRLPTPTGTPLDAIPEAEARAMATTAFGKWPIPPSASATGPELREDRSQDRVTRRYTWKVKFESRPELNVSYIASVVGKHLVSENFSGTLDDAFLKEYKLLKGFSLNISGRRISGVTLINLIVYYLAVAVVFIFGLYRFVQRARQRELSYQRIAVLTFVIAALFLSIILITDVATFDPASQGTPLWPIYIFGTLSYVFMGLFVAVAYGSGEGDLREAYPGKLTSLDALLTGRVFSRNVARSVVVGTAFGGWALLLANVVPFLWRNQPFAGARIENLDFIVGRIPWLSPSVVWPLDVVFTAVTGLLLPLPFLHRRFRSPMVVLGLLAIYAWVAGTGSASTFTPWAGAALIGVVKAATLLVPFFKFDLLSSLVGLASTTYMTASVHFVAQPSSSLQRSGVIALGIGVTFLLVEIYFSYRGRLMVEEEVGPQYAKFLAERLSLQAEVSAAREAQIRLLPQTLPQTDTFSIAAECRPAHEVGGDFYEVFQLDEDRIGIFMAEGGGRGLASALAIAFAKGFLMPKIAGTARGDDSPMEIVRSLQSRLQQTLASDEGMGFVYAVLDSADKTLRYARTGSYPRLVIGTPGDAALSTPQETETRFQVGGGETGKVSSSFSVLSGMSELVGGDCLLVFTDGIVAATADDSGPVEQSLWRSISREGTDSPAKLRKALQGAIDASSKRAQRAGITDDLTALVVRFTS
jgi:serine phosphatase RsbU (regulator of sigma subunit)